jgi:hypothetical protein
MFMTFRHLRFLLVVPALITTSHAIDQPTNESQLRKSIEKFSSFVLSGRLTYERFLPKDKTVKEEYEIEYTFLNGSQRLVSTLKQPGKKDEREAISVATTDLSFQVLKNPDRREEVKYLSPRRGAGRLEMTSAIDQTAGVVCRLPWEFAGQSYAELLEKNLLEWSESQPATADGRKAFAVARLSPSSYTYTESSDGFSHLSGSIGFLTVPYWAVETVDLNYVFKDSPTPVPGLRARLLYKSTHDDGLLLDSISWELLTAEGVSDRYVLNVSKMLFNAAHPDNFTLAGCGIKTVNTSGDYSNIPLLAWYGGLVFVVCVVGLWLIRKRQRSPE